jgi:fibronectin type 3 domain-containing protein
MPGNAGRPLAAGVLVLSAVACAAPLPLADPTWKVLRRAPKSPLASLESVPSAEIPPPEGLRSTSGQPRSVPLKWDPLLTGEVAGYVVERAPAREGPFARLTAVHGHLSTIYIDRGDPSRSERQAPALEDGATYFYRVRSYTSAGRVSATASEVAVATTAPVPEPPRGLRGYSYQPRQVPLGWRASTDETTVGYVVYRSPSSGGPFEPIARLEGRHATVYVDSGLGDLRVFYYRVAALNAFGAEGPPSEPVRAVTKPEPLPPVGLRAAEQRLGANRLSWEPNVETDIREYRLLRLREGADAPELVTEVPPDATAAEDGAVAAGERVEYALVAVDGDGLQSAPSEPIGVESLGYGLSARAESDGVHLRWNPRTAEGFRGARIVRTRWLAGQDLAFVESDAYVDRDAKPGARYRYVVILERPDATRAPPSVPVAVEVPKRGSANPTLR